ncbi:MAG: InlB B-repeat-containing protein [Intestinibacter bartlettii]
MLQKINIYINDKRGATRTYTSKPDKGIIRIIFKKVKKNRYNLLNKQKVIVDVNFDADNGEDVITKSVASGETLDYKPEAPTKDGYTFVGWYKDTDDITTEYKSGATYTESVTYKAKWAHITMLGAQGKLVVDGKSGIRFGTKLYNDGDQIVEKGTLIIPANLVGEGEKLTLDTPKVAISKANVLYQVDYDQNFMTYLGTIVNIPEAQFNRPMTAASYVIYKDKAGNQYTVYSQYPKGSISVYDLLGNDVDWDEKWDETK